MSEVLDVAALRIVDEVFELDGPARKAHLSQVCAGDPKLLKRVESLLAALAKNDAFLREPTISEPSLSNPRLDAEAPGACIGRYRLLQLIGEGGMGSVFMAEQREPVVRKVALKVIKLGMDTKQVVSRFEAERQALALMDHPNIARVLDAGATDAGRPYFVMELVKGEPITAYCDRQRLTTRQRLELFGRVCDAVQHAHTKGIIHRDIKPTNILVSIADAKAIPKVIDFGVAKATAARLTEKTLFTEQGQFIGTPSYMSPEQAEMTAQDIDTRSDVYSLGVLLYELLTGTLPFEAGSLRRGGHADIQRIIREVEPQKPSTRLSALQSAPTARGSESRPPSSAVGLDEVRVPAGGSSASAEGLPAGRASDSAATIAACRRSDPRTLVRALRGDLDWIVMKCLEKDRTRRYETANGVAMEIRRYLNSEPVLAGPPSVRYRARKFVRRNRVGVLAAGLVAAALLLGVIGFAWQARRVALQRDRAENAERTQSALRTQADAERDRAVEAGKTARTERDRADAQRDAAVAARDAEIKARRRADAVNEFVIMALVSSDPNQRGAQSFRVTEAMDQAITQLEAGELKDQPETEAALRLTIAQILNGNARSEDALRIAERALAINQQLHSGDHPDVARSLTGVATCLEGVGRSREALPKFEAALEMFQRLFPGDHSDVAANLNGVAKCLESLGRAAEALPKFEAGLEMYQRLFPSDHPDVAANLNNVAFCLQSLGRPGEALPKYETSLEMHQRILEGDHPSVAQGLDNVAGCLDALGRAGEALPKHEAALEMRQRLFPGDHPEVAQSLNNVAYCLELLGRSAEALPKFEAALEMNQRLFPGDNPKVATNLHNVARCLHSLGRSAEALPKLEAALEMTQRLFPGDNPDVAQSLNNVASCLDSLGRSAEALPRYDAALVMRQRLFPGDHPDVAASLANVAACLRSLGRSGESLPKFEAALGMRQRLFHGDHPDVGRTLHNVAYCLQALDRPAEALPRFEAALQMYRRILPAGHPDVLYPQIGLANTLMKLARFADAEPLLLDAARQCERSQDSRRMHGQNVLNATVDLYKAWHAAEPDKGHADRAAKAISTLVKSVRQDLAPDSPELAGALAQAALQLLSLRTPSAAAEAEPILRECLAIREKVFPDGDAQEWLKYNAMSMLGEAVAEGTEARTHGGRKQGTEEGTKGADAERFREAERLMQDGYNGMKNDPHVPTPAQLAGLDRKAEALQRIIKLYDAWHAADPDNGHAAKAAEWRARLAESQATTQPASQLPPAEKQE